MYVRPFCGCMRREVLLHFVNIATAGDCGGSGGQLQYYSGHGQLSVAASGNVTRRHASNMLLQQYKVCSALHAVRDKYRTA